MEEGVGGTKMRWASGTALGIGVARCTVPAQGGQSIGPIGVSESLEKDMAGADEDGGWICEHTKRLRVIRF